MKIVPKRKKIGKKYITNTFYHYANEYRKHLTSEDEIEKIDMTYTFFNELKIMHKVGELINININAPPTYGKSITAMAIASKQMPIMFNREFGLIDIDRDQQEFSKTMRDPNIEKTIRVIDEWNTLETTGENSTVESALFDYFSDVMAQRMVHKISCSPKNSPDKNALIYLEVINMDKNTLTNHCKLFYKMFSAGIEVMQLLGYVDVYVGNVINKKWYKDYRKRKFEKMGLILNEGIYQPRKLDYAEVILNITSKLRQLCKMTKLVNHNIVRNYVRMETRKYKIPQSIVGEELATRECMGLIDLYKAYFSINKQINSLDIKFKSGKITKSDFDSESDSLKSMQKEITNAWTLQEEELHRFKLINDKYNKVLKKVD